MSNEVTQFVDGAILSLLHRGCLRAVSLTAYHLLKNSTGALIGASSNDR